MTGDLNVALYARVSSDQQVNHGTIESQIAALEEEIAKDGVTVSSEFRFIDNGYSGATLLRPALDRLRDVVAQGVLDRLYVLSPDRLARNLSYQIILIEELRREGVDLRFRDRKAGVTPEEKLLENMQGLIAEYERLAILERSRRGKLHSARKGSVAVLSSAPYGYRYVSRQEGGGLARYEIEFKEAHVIQRIFEAIGRDGITIRGSCRKLMADGIPSPRGRKYWDPSTIWGILRNPAYMGVAGYGKSRRGEFRPRLKPQKGSSVASRYARSTYDQPQESWLPIAVPPIVAKDLFEAAQERLAANRARARERMGTPSKNLLRGLVVCGCCGYAFYGVASKTYRYYRCTSPTVRRFVDEERLCTNRSVRAEDLEEGVWEDVRDLLTEPERITEEFKRRQEHTDGGALGELLKNQRKLRKRAQQGVARLIDAYAQGLLKKSEFESRIAPARAHAEALLKEEESLEAETSREEYLRVIVTSLETFANEVHDKAQVASFETRRKIVQALVERVEINPKEVRIVYRVGSSGGPRRSGPTPPELSSCGRRGSGALQTTPIGTGGRRLSPPSRRRRESVPWVTWRHPW